MQNNAVLTRHNTNHRKEVMILASVCIAPWLNASAAVSQPITTCGYAYEALAWIFEFDMVYLSTRDVRCICQHLPLVHIIPWYRCCSVAAAFPSPASLPPIGFKTGFGTLDETDF
jgi:hypothetical protein